MNEPPCVNCIVLAMCKQKIINGDLIDLFSMVDDCPSFNEYLYSKSWIEDEETRVDTLVNNLKLSLLKGIPFYNGVKRTNCDEP